MLALALAFAAGVLTVAAPCVLPMLPIVLGGSVGCRGRWRPVCIVAGFVTAFAALTVAFSLVSHIAGMAPEDLRTAAIAGLLLFGALLVWRRPFDVLAVRATIAAQSLAARDRARPHSTALAVPAHGFVAGFQPSGHWSGFALGLTLGAVWSPCAGPVLGSVLTLLATAPTPHAAAVQLLAYAMGAGVPMLAIAYGGQWAGQRVRLLARHLPAVQRVFGLLVIAVALAMHYQYDVLLAAWLTQWLPDFSRGL